MKIRLICFGKLKNPALRTLADDYAARIGRFAPFELAELRDGAGSDPVARLAGEARTLSALLEKSGKGGGGGYGAGTFLFDERGADLDTPAFARALEKSLQAAPVVDFIIGSSHGVDPAFKAKVPQAVRLSSLTLTHEWARALALEQIYRAFCVLRGFPYHH